MTKRIEDYTADELSAKIKAIKAERERTADAPKLYDEELERRKNKKWLPLDEEINFTINQISLDTTCIEIKVREGFYDKDSFYKYLSALKTIRKAWFANSKGEPIDIEVLKPLLPKGKVLYSPNDKKWKWINNRTVVRPENYGWFLKGGHVIQIEGFNIKPAENWEDSLMECGL